MVWILRGMSRNWYGVGIIMTCRNWYGVNTHRDEHWKKIVPLMAILVLFLFLSILGNHISNICTEVQAQHTLGGDLSTERLKLHHSCQRRKFFNILFLIGQKYQFRKKCHKSYFCTKYWFDIQNFLFNQNISIWVIQLNSVSGGKMIKRCV